jgi:hypothetical protein
VQDTVLSTAKYNSLGRHSAAKTIAPPRTLRPQHKQSSNKCPLNWIIVVVYSPEPRRRKIQACKTKRCQLQNIIKDSLSDKQPQRSSRRRGLRTTTTTQTKLEQMLTQIDYRHRVSTHISINISIACGRETSTSRSRLIYNTSTSTNHEIDKRKAGHTDVNCKSKR